MSNKALTWAWSLRSPLPDGRKLPKSAKDVLVRMADYSNQAWECYPSQELIAEEVMVSRKTVQRAIAELITLGLLTRVGYLYGTGEGSVGGRHRTLYRVGPVKETVTIEVRGDDPWVENDQDDDLERLEDILSPKSKTPVQRLVENSERLGDILSPNPQIEGGLGDTDDRVRGQMASRVKGLTPNEPNHHQARNVTTEANANFDDDDASRRDDDSSSAGGDLGWLARVGVDVADLQAGLLQAGIDPAGLNVDAAARVILGRASARVPANPTKFVLTALLRNPTEFSNTAHTAPVGVSRHECDRDGHSWKLTEAGLWCPVCDEIGPALADTGSISPPGRMPSSYPPDAA